MADLKTIRREIELSDVGPPAILNSKTILALLDCAEALHDVAGYDDFDWPRKKKCVVCGVERDVEDHSECFIGIALAALKAAP